jgi:tetratricopeptide (TPR) repeat protein
MKKITNILILGLVAFSLTQCKGYLDVQPQGSINANNVGKSSKTIDGLVIAAYSWVPAQEASCCLEGATQMTPWLADIKSGDSYKGGGGLNDQTPWYQMEVFSLVTPDVGNNDGIWFGAFEGISRINTALRALDKAKESDYPQKTERIAEMRFLRGHIYFKLKMRYRWIPYFRENASDDSIKTISNHPDSAKSDMYLWKDILQDFQFAAKHLPATQKQIGRPNKYAADAEAANVLMWMAYPEDENNQVTTINKDKLKQALSYLNDIINSGQYHLTPQFGHNFLASYDNKTPGSIWAWHFSYDDGTTSTGLGTPGNLDAGHGLTAPWWPPNFSCCDFHKPSFSVVNVFKTNNGLPEFKDWNSTSAYHNRDPYFANNTFDPRLGHTVAIPGLPWKYQTNLIYDSSASRKPSFYGYFHTLKDNVQTTAPGLTNFFWMFNAKNMDVVRYDRVLLLKAEALIQLGNYKESLPIINEIRKRAANSTKLLKFANGKPTLDYKISLYKPGVNTNWTKQFAWKALKWEDHLEFATEGERWHDLVRWGIAAKVMNKHFKTEEPRGRSWLKDGHFTKGRDEYMPIPQNQINLSRGVYKQNVGY